MKKPPKKTARTVDPRGKKKARGGAAGAAVVRPAPRPAMPTLADYNPALVPCDGPTRRARGKMLAKYLCRIGEATLSAEPDPYEARELRRQEAEDVVIRELFAAALRLPDPWRAALIIEAKTCKDAYSELGARLAAAFAGDDGEGEALAFCRAREAVAAHGGEKNARLAAMLFAHRHKLAFGCCPTRAAVRQWLVRGNLLRSEDAQKDSSRRRHEARDFFTGPILGGLPRGKPGRTKRAP